MRTNEIVYKFNEEDFLERFSVFRASCGDMWKNPIVDFLKNCEGAESIAYENGRSCYILVNRDMEDDFQDQALDFSCTLELVPEVSERLAAQLLLNSLTADEPEKIWNLTGRCYIPHLESATKHSFPVLDIYIDTENRMQLRIRTFSKFYDLLEYYKVKNPKRAGKISRYPRFKKTMFGLQRSDDGDYILLHDIDALNEKKSRLNFLSLKEADYEETKMYDLYYIMSELHNKYGDLIHLSYKEVSVSKAMIRDNKDKTAEAETLSGILMEKEINLVNQTDDQEEFDALYGCFTEHTHELIEKNIKSREIHHLPIIRSEDIRKNALNICMVHEKSWYGNMKDCYVKNPDIPVQHITVETIRNCKDSKELLPATTKSLFDVLIKNDIQNEQMSLFHWNSLNLLEPVSFCVEVEPELYGSVTISPNGSLKFHIGKTDMAARYLQMDSSYKIVMVKGSDINIIQDTDFFTIPDLNEIFTQMNYVPKKKSISRSRENIERVIPDIVDIRSWEKNGDMYYIVGNNSYGTDGKFPKATPVRKVSPRPGSELFFGELLPTLAMPYVRNKLYTVYPFPVKYIREYYEWKKDFV